MSYLSTRHAEPFFAPPIVVSGDLLTSEILNDLLVTLTATSLTLLSLGAYGKYTSKKSLSLTAKSGLGVAGDTIKTTAIKIDSSTILRLARRSVGIGLPFLATLQLGGLAVSVLMLVMISSGLLPVGSEHFDLGHFQGWKRLLSQKTWTLAFSSLLCLAAVQYTSSSWLSSVIGILAVIVLAFFCNPPYLAKAAPESSFMSPPASAKSTSTVPATPWDVAEPLFALPASRMSSALISSARETSLTMMSGALTAAAAGLLYQFCNRSLMTPEFVAILLLVSSLTIWSLSGIEIAIFGEAPLPLLAGLAATISGNALLFSNFQSLWQDVILGAMAYMAVRLDVANSEAASLAHTHLLSREKHNRPRNRNISAPTKILLQSTERYSLLHGILADKDSRRIFYFMLLNLSFMLVQSTYGVLTGSLGLISDSIHMFFDCFALLVGLCAAVMSKWPPSIKYPYGYGKLDTLAGFGNGIFLMLISVEIVWEAVERLVEGSDVSRTMELLIVSSLGLAVNLVGIMAFEHGHGHGGHDNSHGGHAHSHAGHAHAHSAHSTSSSASVAKPEKSHHHHGGDNMYGIYLHIMADALGSVAVVISTLCVRYFGWSGFDPLASCAIAVLIFASAVPLVFSSGKKLLLSLPGDVEYTLRDILAGVSTVRGVVGYTVPKFWLDDVGKNDSEHQRQHEDAGDHHHDHNEHTHGPDHSHSHSHSHHQHHHSDHGHRGECENQVQLILGVIHVMASQHADLGDVRTRVSDYLRSKNMDIVVQVEREGDVKCWCGGGQKSG
jgi:solute carrier family 30 (zinc transporter), member 5/7